MKKFKVLTITIIVAVIAVGFVGCEPGIREVEVEVDKTCPEKRDFQITLNFDAEYKSNVLDTRTTKESATLENIGGKNVVAIIQSSIQGAYAGAGWQQDYFDDLFKNGVTIIVENPASSYKMKTLGRTIYFHINYLTGDISDIQGHIKEAMNKMISNDPYGPIVKAAPARDGFQKLNRHAIALNNKRVNALRSRAFA